MGRRRAPLALDPARTGGSSRVARHVLLFQAGRQDDEALRFEHHAGLYFLECHNLEHEDAGMILSLEVM